MFVAIIGGALFGGALLKDYAERQRAFAPMRDFLNSSSQRASTETRTRVRNARLLRVVNVPAGKSLAIMNRAGGSSQGARVVLAIGPTASGIELTGTKIRIGGTVWAPVRYRRVTGWIDDRYLAPQ